MTDDYQDSLAFLYVELRQGRIGTPAQVRAAYAQPFTMVNTADGPIAARYTDLLNNVAAGDSLLFRGWFMELLETAPAVRFVKLA